MTSCIETSRAVVTVAEDIATSVANSIKRSPHRGQGFDLPLAVAVSLKAATE